MCIQKKKIDFWSECTTKRELEYFSIMQAFLEKNEEQASNMVINKIFEHLKQIKNSLEQYFPAARMLKIHE